MQSKPFLVFCCACSLLAPQSQVFAADKKAPEPGQRETIAKPMSDKEKKRKEDRLRKELETPWKSWLNVDVAYIITDEERTAFKRFNTDEERQQFVEGFWLRRDPTPDTEENEFKEEHYRRIAYANERYASGIPGWKSDRGRIYITFGPPDEIDSHPSGGSYQRPTEEGGGSTSTYPFEQWRYRYIEGIGSDINIEFVDPTMSGEYRLTMDPSEKDALLYVPGAGLTQMEQMGLSSKNDRFSRTDGTHLGTGNTPMTAKMGQFERLEQFSKLQRPPATKFPDLEAVVSSSIRFNTLPMKVRADYIPVTPTSIFTYITIQFDRKDLQFAQKNGIATATVNIFARITSMARRHVNSFEDVVTVPVPQEMLQQVLAGSSVYQKTVPLAPGKYRLNIVAKDITGGNMTNYEVALDVPRMEDDRLSASSVILADLIEKVPTKSIGTGQFVIGASKVRPRMSESFKRDEKLGIYFQVYNFEQDAATHKPSGTIEYEIRKNGSDKAVFAFSEPVEKLAGAGTQVTVERILSLKDFEPGSYTLKMKVTDKTRNQILTPSAAFTVS